MPLRHLRPIFAGLVAAASIAGCVVEPAENVAVDEPDVELPADPPGTVTTNLLADQYQNTFDFETGTVGGDSTNADIGLDNAMNLSTLEQNDRAAPKIAGVGAVLGLGAVVELPAQGYTEAVAATAGNGYVVVTKEGNAYRFFVDGMLTSAETGGLIGVRMKWALLKQNVRPDDPIALAAELSGSAITVTWAALEGVQGYRVYYDERYTGGGQGSPTPEGQPVVDVATTTYTHSPVASNHTYRFYVTATYPWGETYRPPSSFDWPTTVAVP